MNTHCGVFSPLCIKFFSLSVAKFLHIMCVKEAFKEQQAKEDSESCTLEGGFACIM